MINRELLRICLMLAAIFLGVFVGLPLISGCSRTQTQADRKVEVEKYLPHGAKVLEDRGNGWWLVEIGGRKYLHRHNTNSHGAVETLVEVRGTP